MRSQKNNTDKFHSRPNRVDRSNLRSKAEQMARNQNMPNPAKMTDEEIRQMVHEIRVKQLETELENEHLRQEIQEQDERVQLLETVTENMFDLVGLTDLAGNFTFAGKSHQILGYDPDFLIGKNVMDFVHPDDLPHISEEFDAFISSGQTHTVNYRYRCKNGTYIWLETVGNIIHDEEESPAQIVFSTRDITQRKQVEEDLIQKQKLLEGIIDGIPGILSIKRPDFTVERYNRTGYDVLGLSSEHLNSTFTHGGLIFRQKTSMTASYGRTLCKTPFSTW